MNIQMYIALFWGKKSQFELGQMLRGVIWCGPVLLQEVAAQEKEGGIDKQRQNFAVTFCACF